MAKYLHMEYYILQRTSNTRLNNGAAAQAHLGNEYVQFCRVNAEQLRQVVVDEFWVNTLFEVSAVRVVTLIKRLFSALVRIANETTQQLASGPSRALA